MIKDSVYLKHILDTIADLEKFLKGVSEENFFKNREKQYAVLRALEIIGEASKNLSSEAKVKSPDVDWKNIAGLRDKLIHAYFGVNLTLVWEILQRDIPELKKQAQKLLDNFSTD